MDMFWNFIHMRLNDAFFCVEETIFTTILRAEMASRHSLPVDVEILESFVSFQGGD